MNSLIVFLLVCYEYTSILDRCFQSMNQKNRQLDRCFQTTKRYDLQWKHN